MNYIQALNYVHSMTRFGIKPGLDRTAALLRAVGEPQRGKRFVHVAGTNGKGSTSTMLAEILMSSGYKTGLFTSPYVTDFRERICINGEMIPENEFAQLVTRLVPAVNELTLAGDSPTEFEIITAAAFGFFADRGCDVCVLETGLGGRLDSTNIISTPLVSVITSISLDHMAVLGDTVEKIAAEKCGIIKKNGVTVCYPLQPGGVIDVVSDAAAKMNNRLVIPDTANARFLKTDINGSNVEINSMRMHLHLNGSFQLYNALTAVTAAEELAESGLTLAEGAIEKGISNAVVPARQELISANPTVILDGGHNPGGAAELAKSIRTLLPGRRVIAVCAMMADKDCREYIRLTAPCFSRFFACTLPGNPRAMDASALCALAADYCEDCTAVNDPFAALEAATEELKADDVLLVCGSLYLAGELRERMLTRFSEKK